jgi:signal transduction histidine kinase
VGDREEVDQLGERVKELRALHSLARLLCEPFSTCNELFTEIAALLPPAMLHVDDCVVRLRHGEIEVTAGAVRAGAAPRATLAADFQTSDGTTGVIEVGYLDEHAPQVEGPFLAEERALVASVSELVRAAIDRRILDGALHRAARLEAMSALAASVAHDFNNLLASIRANGEVLVEQLPEASDLRGAAADIVAASQRGATLAKQLVEMGRKKTRGAHFVELNTAVEKMMPIVEPLLGERVRLHVDLASGVGRVDCDPTELDRVIMNLVVNARDAMPAGGTIRVRTSVVMRNGRPFGRLSVCDDGVGVPRALLPRIFEPYFTTKAEGEGTGLGLALVWRVVNDAAGQVEVESEPGKGAAFHVDLPRV